MTARNRLDLPEPDGPTRLTTSPWSTSMLAPSRTGSLPYEIVKSRTRNSASDDRGVVQPGHARAGFDEAAGDQALLDALGRVQVDAHRFGIERIAVTRDDLAELLELEPGGHLLGESRDHLIACHLAQPFERICQRLGQSNHFRPALFDLLGAHRNAHEFEGTAEIVLGVFEVH